MGHVSITGPGELVRQFEPNCHAHEHAKARLLGDERVHRACALVHVGLAGDTGYLRVVGLSEPTTLGERFGKHPLECGGGVSDHVLGVREPPWLDERLQCGVHLGSCVGVVYQSRLIIRFACAQTDLARLSPSPSVRPSAPPVTPASQLASGIANGRASITSAIAATPSRSAS